MNDMWIKCIVIANISVIGLLSIVGIIIIKEPPAILPSLAVASVTGLLGYLAPSPVQNQKQP